ncbi:MAG TPA: PrsW family glutamic-type intramembrane protease [Planctomycetota bacterium]|nr:PrsW family glutamic-type intramembrane protease [Planctomycetota bacterium]
MALWRALLLASAPALLFLYLFWRRDRNREPRLLVLKLFGLGVLAAVPAYFLEGWLPGPSSRLFDNFVRIGLVEEAMKLLPFLLFACRNPAFDEPMDGIVYAAAAALGFATAENALYATVYGGDVLVYRAFTSTLAHLAFAGLWGYAWGIRRRRAGAFAAAVGLHGAYDLLLSPGEPTLRHRMTQGLPLSLLALGALLPALLLVLYLAVRDANLHAKGNAANATSSMKNATEPTPTCSDFASRR